MNDKGCDLVVGTHAERTSPGGPPKKDLEAGGNHETILAGAKILSPIDRQAASPRPHPSPTLR